MWDICGTGSDQETNSDGYGSDLETFLYSTVYHNEEEKEPVPEASSTVAISNNDVGPPVLIVVKPIKRRAGASMASAEELRCAVKKAKKSNMRASPALAAKPKPNASVTAHCILLSSDDDEVIVLSDDSQENISLNVMGTAQDKENKSGLWHVDAEDLYRSSRGFRYHHSLANVRCRSCDQLGHLAKHCPQPKIAVCPLCSELGHSLLKCPQRMCSRCYMRGHILRQCKQAFVPRCSRCKKKGHPDERCPDLWRRYHITTVDGPIVRADVKVRPPEERFCFNCGRQGHYGHQCRERKQGDPATPFIISYKDPFRPEQPPLVLRDEKRKQHAEKKRQRKSEQLKKRCQMLKCSGQATSRQELTCCGGKAQAALHNGQTRGIVHNEDPTQSETPPSEAQRHAAEDRGGQQTTQDGGALAAKLPAKAAAPMSKSAARRRRQKLKEKRKKKEKQRQQRMKKSYQGEGSYAQCSKFDNPSFHMPNNWCNKTF